MKLDGKKPSLAEMFSVAEERAKPSTPSDGRRDKPQWKFTARPTGGLKPDGVKVKGELKF
jgi:hypothetical protein